MKYYLKPADALWYYAWRTWRQAGKPKGMRPVRAPRVIPLRAWRQYREADLDDKRRQAEAALATRLLRLSWWDKVSFGVAWSGRDPWAICSHIATLGGDQVWVQANSQQRQRSRQWREAATHFGLDLVIWLWPDGDADEAIRAVNLFAADGLVINVEHVRKDWPEYVADLRAALPIPFPMGVWTNFWGVLADDDTGYKPSLAKPWIDAEFACIPEAYIVNERGEQPTLNPNNLASLAGRYGFQKIIPSFGIYRCGPERYMPYIAPSGPFTGYNWYLYEYYPGGA